MQIFPVHRETIISSYSAEKVEQILWKITKPTSGKIIPSTPEEQFKFYGWVKKSHFNIFLKISYPQNALPLIVGSIETTKVGCIIFLQYKLFSGPLLLLWFSVFLCLFFCLFFILVTKDYIYAGVAGTIGFLYYFVMIYNFNLHVKNSQFTLHQALNEAA